MFRSLFFYLSLAIFTGGHLAQGEPGSYAPARSVLGQPNLTTETVEDPANARSLNFPEGVAVDPASGKVFVADSENNRILRFPGTEAYKTAGTAEAVFGQADFTSTQANRGGSVARNSLSYPLMLAIDSGGRLWVTDYRNNRVLRFDDAATKGSGVDADAVIGQPDFETADSPAAPTSMNGHSKFDEPCGIAVDSSGNLYVADYAFHRVLRFDNAVSKSFETMANAVFGQPDLESSDDSVVSAASLSMPYGLSIGPDGELWVADAEHFRVLRYDSAASFSSGGDADGVLGQADFMAGMQSPSPTRSSFVMPFYVSAQDNGTVWVSDYSGVRVMGFRNASGKANGALADVLLGQPTYTAAPHLDADQRTLRGPAQIAFGREGSLFVAVWDQSRVVRFSDPVSVRPKKKTLKTSRSRVTFRGTSTGAQRVQYKVSGQGGFKNVRGNAQNWRAKTKKLEKKRTRVAIRAIAFDGASASSRMNIVRKPR